MTIIEAEELESKIIAKYSDHLVNWQNMGRPINFKLLKHYHELRDANQKLIQETKAQ
jgi:hypothetical protein